ncbi:MAG: DUF3164 family protein [Phenylobacterium sp.]|uniref:DUF3164 family protein n=1 Tax=Phenylobacterium sp. TaxID=1871053 RepID=UPI00391BEC82
MITQATPTAELARAVSETFEPGTFEIEGQTYMRNHKGALVPVESIRPADKLMDETVRKILGYAKPLADQIARFKRHTLQDVAAFQDILSQEYGTTRGGPKGNVTLTTFDGLMKVQVQVADRVVFGPELQEAKKLVDACLNEWATDANAALRTIVQSAFSVDQEGKVSPSELFTLLRHDIQDERWQTAMRAIRDSIRIEGSKEYVRFYRRARPTDPWEAVSIDVAAA